jgi:hypothetical protein
MKTITTANMNHQLRVAKDKKAKKVAALDFLNKDKLKNHM